MADDLVEPSEIVCSKELIDAIVDFGKQLWHFSNLSLLVVTI